MIAIAKRGSRSWILASEFNPSRNGDPPVGNARAFAEAVAVAEAVVAVEAAKTEGSEEERDLGASALAVAADEVVVASAVTAVSMLEIRARSLLWDRKTYPVVLNTKQKKGGTL